MKWNITQRKPWDLTLQVSDDDLIVVGSREQVMGAGWESHRSDVAGVRLVRLDHASSSDVIQHTGAVLLPCRQQTSTRVDRYRRHRAACNITYNTDHMTKQLQPIQSSHCKCRDNIYVVNYATLNQLISINDYHAHWKIRWRSRLMLTWAMKGRPYHSYTARYPQVPKTHSLILRARCYHPASPRVERKDMTWNQSDQKKLNILLAGKMDVYYFFKSSRVWFCTRVSAERVQTLSSLAVGCVDVTVSSTRAD